MAVVRKKQDDKFLKALRELVTTGGGNRQCFDCGQKGPTYVNMTIGSFVCTRCSGVLRGLTPPHRVKSISMATFTQEEIDFLKAHGNDLCAKTWLGLWDPKRAVHQDHRELMIDKYERKRYYLEPASPLKSLTNATSLKNTNNNNNNNSNNNNNNNNSSSVNNNSSAAAGATITTTSSSSLSSSSSSSSSTHNNTTNGNIPSQTNGYGIASGLNHKHNSIDNSFSNIQLTPPTSQRNHTMNGLHKSSSSAISRPTVQNGFNQQHHHHHHHQQQQQQPHDAFMVNSVLMNGLSSNSLTTNGFKNASSIGSASTGALSDTSSCASNGFGPDGDFVADFGTANIFDATSASSVGSPAVSSASSVASSNGYAKIQPIKAAHQFMNGNANAKHQQMNGTSSTTNNNNNNDNNENFADFDHAPIYNAAANYEFISKSNLRNTTASITRTTTTTTTTTAITNSALLHQQKRQLKQQQQNMIISTIMNTMNNNNNNNNNNNFAKSKLTAETSATASTDAFGSNNSSNSNSSNRSVNHSSNNMNNNEYNISSTRRPTATMADIFFSESTSNFNDPFDDFSTITLSNGNSNKFALDEEESDFGMEQPQQQQQQQTFKFTPLAMAAHATAMAVLGSNYHFNNKTDSWNSKVNNKHIANFTDHQRNINEEYNQWGEDVWQELPLASTPIPATPLTPLTPITPIAAAAAASTSTSMPTPTIGQKLFNSFWTTNHNDYDHNDDYDDDYGDGITKNSNNRYGKIDATTTKVPLPSTTINGNSLYSNNNNNSSRSYTHFHNTADGKTKSSTSSILSSSILVPTLTPTTASPPTISTYQQNVSLCVPSYSSTLLFPSSSAQVAATSTVVPFSSTNPFLTSSSTSLPAQPPAQQQQQQQQQSSFPLHQNNHQNNDNNNNNSNSMPVGIFARNSTSLFNTFSSTTCSPNCIDDQDRSYSGCDSFDSSSLPIPNGIGKSSAATNGNNNNNNNQLSSTPTEDRYAALKDLDEQLRESKAVAAAAASIVALTVVDSFGNNNNINSNTNGTINPFNHQQQQQHQPGIIMANPFQGNHLTQATQQQNLFGQMTVIPNGIANSNSNGFVGAHQTATQHHQTPPQANGFFNYSNGYTATANSMFAAPSTNSVPNGCGFGFGAMQQQIAVATGGGGVGGMNGGVFNNPFGATGALNTNNPFL